jgi:hypothetical protein
LLDVHALPREFGGGLRPEPIEWPAWAHSSGSLFRQDAVRESLAELVPISPVDATAFGGLYHIFKLIFDSLPIGGNPEVECIHRITAESCAPSR